MPAPKLQRWIDLLAALLRRRFPATFEELARDVPAYAAATTAADEKTRDSVMRMFERDKDELRAFGIAIRSEISPDGESHGYKLAARDFYLPYLALVTEQGSTRPANTTREFYRALAHLTFEPDELAAVVDASARVAQLDEPALAADARGAHRKLAFDLPTDAVRPDPAAPTVHAAKGSDPRTFETLGDALRRRKVVTFGYHAMHTGSEATRTVDPYGLFFLGGHWYLVGRDHDRDALRNFRVSRIRDPKPNTKSPAKPDYDIPTAFDLEAHATAKSTWELGDAPSTAAIVEFRNVTGPVAAATRLGDAVEHSATNAGTSRRRFVVRRRDAFARWLLSFGGDAVPVEPPALVDEFRQLAARTRAVYAGGEPA